MEVKINKEIREYTENVYFGLSLRQFACSIFACLSSIIVYFIFQSFLNLEMLSWICILAAIPFVLMGFVKYNGMNAEEFIIAYFKSEFLISKELKFMPSNYYYECLKDRLEVDVNENN